MLYAWIDSVKRPPLTKGERTTGLDCGGRINGGLPVRKGEFALCRVPRDQFVRSVQGLV